MTSAEDTPPKNNRWLYISLWLANFFSPLVYTSVTNVLPTIANDYHASAADISLIVMLFAFSQGLFGAIGGRMSDLFGLRKMMNIGFLICSLTLIGLFLSPNFASLTLFRLIQGIGTALLFCCSIAIAVNITHTSKRGMILGLLTSAAYLGGSLGPLFGGAIATFWGWRPVFIFLLIPCIIPWAIFHHTVKTEWNTLADEKFDTKGAIVLGLSLACISVGAGFANHDLLYTLFLPIGFVLAYIFIKMQKNTLYPIINITLFSNIKGFGLGLMTMLINFGSMSAIIYFTTMYFQQIRDYTPLMAGVFLLVRSIPQFIITPIAGRYADKSHPEIIIIIGLAICTFCIAIMAFLDENTSIYLIAVLLLLTGIGIAIFAAPITLSTLRNIPLHDIGVASGLTATSRSLGVLSSQVLISLAITNYMGSSIVSHKTASLFLDAMHSSLMLMAVLNVICLIAYILYTKHLFEHEKKTAE